MRTSFETSGLADVKTATSRRTIDLDERTVAAMRAWRKHQVEEQLLVGRRDDDASLVFAQADGSPVHPDYFSQVFERHVARSELPRIRLHDLRHTHATILLQAGVPVKVVSERLGHSSPAFTMSVYQHVLPGMQADAALDVQRRRIRWRRRKRLANLNARAPTFIQRLFDAIRVRR